ncbi:MAG: peptide chain release factor 2 [Lachnospiraceae bacterium]|jgi:peptide chain release factor 2|nr:peptide chain release factor 2 [Lachnospiraceae bacterium]
MVALDQVKYELNQYTAPLKEVGESLDLEKKSFRVEEIEGIMEEEGFWNDADKAQNYMKELKNLKDTIQEYRDLETQFKDLYDLIDMVNEENDESMVPEVQAEFEKFTNNFEEVRLATLLDGEFDKNNAIVTLHAGAGGTEACDWCSMLYRMYSMWAQSKGFSLELLDFLEGDEAGYKSVTLQINGMNAYGHLKSEHGVHRLVRISPFNAQAKRQTSFVSCDVMPDIEEDLDIDIPDDDIRIDIFRSSGAGGQKVNKTSSAIRITHFPTGIVVSCQNERSQYQNKDKAMQILKSKLLILKQQENLDKTADIRGEVKDNNFGSQIRSYFLQPYKMIKDLRTGVSTANADAVLNGGIDLFINGYLKWLKQGCPPYKGGDLTE